MTTATLNELTSTAPTRTNGYTQWPMPLSCRRQNKPRENATNAEPNNTSNLRVQGHRHALYRSRRSWNESRYYTSVIFSENPTRNQNETPHLEVTGDRTTRKKPKSAGSALAGPFQDCNSIGHMLCQDTYISRATTNMWYSNSTTISQDTETCF